MKKLIAISLSLILALVLVCAASAETVQAKPVEIDPSNLEGRNGKNGYRIQGRRQNAADPVCPGTF